MEDEVTALLQEKVDERQKELNRLLNVTASADEISEARVALIDAKVELARERRQK